MLSLMQQTHTPIPIPNQWKQKIKESLDGDVEKALVKPVP